jgi:ubiquinone/menaquinone biosynthesis C-methylase UbiE
MRGLSLKMIFLPGTDKQLNFLLDTVDPKDLVVLQAGSQGDKISTKIHQYEPASIHIITDNSSDLMEMRFRLKEKNIPVKLMDYTNTDFRDNTFDLVYSQGTFSTSARRKIYKEVLRIMKDDGIICSGEIVKMEEKVPRFMQDVWDTSGIAPLSAEKLMQFYEESGLEIIAHKNLSYTLKEFYRSGREMLSGFLQDGSADEKKYYKKIINRISHEANAYLNLGGEKYMQYHTFILKRKL